MEFKYHNFTVEVNDFDAEYDSIRDNLSTYMWEVRYADYEEYMTLRRANFTVEDEYQREYNSSYNIAFGMECARQDYERHIDQECNFIVTKWQDQFNGISEEKSPRRRRNALTGRL